MERVHEPVVGRGDDRAGLHQGDAELDLLVIDLRPLREEGVEIGGEGHRDWNIFHVGPYQRSIWLDQLLPVALILLPVCVFFLRRRGKSIGYLLCFCLFGAYLWEFASYTIFPFPLHFNPRGFRYAGLHLIPAILEGNDPNFRIQNEQVYGNFLTGLPFGFGLPFVVAPKNSTPRRMLWLGLALGLMPELAQLVQNLLFDDFLMRTVDIDDVWLCFAGTVAGYGVLRAAAYVYRHFGVIRGARLPVWEHFHAVLLDVANGTGGLAARSENQ